MAQFFDEFLGNSNIEHKVKTTKVSQKRVKETPKVVEQLYVTNREKDIVEEDAYAIIEEVEIDIDYAQHIVLGELLNTPRFKRRRFR